MAVALVLAWLAVMLLLGWPNSPWDRAREAKRRAYVDTQLAAIAQRRQAQRDKSAAAKAAELQAAAIRREAQLEVQLASEAAAQVRDAARVEEQRAMAAEAKALRSARRRRSDLVTSRGKLPPLPGQTEADLCVERSAIASELYGCFEECDTDERWFIAMYHADAKVSAQVRRQLDVEERLRSLKQAAGPDWWREQD